MENLNYQITSTIAGVDYLKKLNVEYVMKTRTDQRIYDINLDIYLINLLKEYPINNKFQKERIIGIGDNTYKYIPFSFSDMFQFGNINDIEVMWSLPLTKRRFTIEDRIKINPTIKEMQKFSNCEMYLCISFLKRTNYKIEYTLESYYKSLKERFLIVDNINIYWFKYNSLKDKTENFLLKDEKMTYNDWTNLYKSFNNIDFRILNEIELKIFQTKLYK
ncbi:WavE lipopolysaccharide synthesis [Fusobacterium varium]|nr:WavE lipopolysaccharide synthesis family protein [Fusobacterium varium]VEH39701.1 WavE lipopolysaccharide synthesis [Fusobacterium varium]